MPNPKDLDLTACPLAVLDACVLYPTVMRQVLLGLAHKGLFRPIWSPRILGEWKRAALRHHPGSENMIGAEIALCGVAWPNACWVEGGDLVPDLHLPDPDDTHVLATAIAARSAVIITMNLRDFPRRILARHGVYAIHPDQYARILFDQNPVPVVETVLSVRSQAEHLSGDDWPLRKLMKKARMPRLGKAVETADRSPPKV